MTVEYLFIAGIALGTFALVGLIAGPCTWACERLYRECIRRATIDRLREGER